MQHTALSLKSCPQRAYGLESGICRLLGHHIFLDRLLQVIGETRRDLPTAVVITALMGRLGGILGCHWASGQVRELELSGWVHAGGQHGCRAYPQTKRRHGQLSRS